MSRIEVCLQLLAEIQDLRDLSSEELYELLITLWREGDLEEKIKECDLSDEAADFVEALHRAEWYIGQKE